MSQHIPVPRVGVSAHPSTECAGPSVSQLLGHGARNVTGLNMSVPVHPSASDEKS